MSLKIKGDDVMWTPPVDSPEYHYGELDCALSTGAYELHSPTMKVVFHPKWIERMNKIEIGDLVTDEAGRVGLVIKEELQKPELIEILGVRRFVVSFSGKEEVCHSFVLHKIEETK